MGEYAGQGDRDIPLIFIGISPAATARVTKASSFVRLVKWCELAGIAEWDFHNLITTPGSSDRNDIDETMLRERLRFKWPIIALGTFVGRELIKRGIHCFRIDHPSSRNRNFNDPGHESTVIDSLRTILLLSS